MTGDTGFQEACNSLKGDEETMGEAILDRMEELFQEQGEQRMLAMTKLLLDANRISDLKRATIDVEYRNQLLRELMPTEKNEP